MTVTEQLIKEKIVLPQELVPKGTFPQTIEGGKKYCSRCHALQTTSSFDKNVKSENGLHFECKSCRSRHYKPHKERQRMYGISEADFQAMLKQQRGKCKICTKTLTKPHVDHCHKSKKVRGLLCLQCNIGLGMFADSPKLLRKAANYLE